jgi:hypothetical protein
MSQLQLAGRVLTQLLGMALVLAAGGPADEAFAQVVDSGQDLQKPTAVAAPRPTILPQPQPFPIPIPCETAFAPMANPPACTPILETVYVSPSGTMPGRVASVSWYGSVPIQPADSITLRVRAPYPTTLVVLVNGKQLPQIAPGASPPNPDDSGYYSVTVQQMSGPPATAWSFWEIAMKLPKPFRSVGGTTNVPALTVTLRDISPGAFAGNKKQAPDLNITMAGYTFQNCSPPNCASASPLLAPSEVFETGENSKNDTEFPNMPRAMLGIVARPVTLAGWLAGGSELQGSGEDYHFSIYLDPDFIQRNYPPNTLPFLGAMLPGQPERQGCWEWHSTWGGDYACPCGVDPVAAIPGCVQRFPLANGSVPDVASLLMPGSTSDALTVELNAWHVDHRGPAPARYQQDATITNNFWAFDPVHGTNFPPNAPQHVLAEGDYVIVTGTLWQDQAHADNGTTFARNACFDRVFAADGGWLEIHPVDVVRYVSPAPALRKQPRVVPACSTTHGVPAAYPDSATGQSGILHAATPPPTTNSVLRFQEFIDPRFTDPNSTNIFKNAYIGCGTDGTLSVLNVSASDLNLAPAGISTYKSVFLLWWEESPTPRPPCPTVLSGVARIIGQSPLTVFVIVTDAGSKLPVPGVLVWVQDIYGRPQASATTNTDGAVSLQFATCPKSWGYTLVPSPACTISARKVGYDPLDLWTPALAGTGAMTTANALLVNVSDLVTKTNVSGATVSVHNAQGQPIVSGTTAADGTMTLNLSACQSGFSNICSNDVSVTKAGYLGCSFPIPTQGLWVRATCQ